VDESAPGSVFSFVERVGFANSCGCLVFVDEFGEEVAAGTCCLAVASSQVATGLWVPEIQIRAR
jgi:hypothetical protein